MCWVMPPDSPRGDGRVADGVEQARLAVVDVAHDRHDRGTGDEVGGIIRAPRRDADAIFGGAGSHQIGCLTVSARSAALGDELHAHLGGHQGRRVVVDGLVDGREDPVPDQLADDRCGADPQGCRKILDDDRGADLHRRRRAGAGSRSLPPRPLPLRWTRAASAGVGRAGSGCTYAVACVTSMPSARAMAFSRPGFAWQAGSAQT